MATARAPESQQPAGRRPAACDAAMDRSDALCGFVDPSQWTRAPGMVTLLPPSLSNDVTTSEPVEAIPDGPLVPPAPSTGTAP